jgi:hypothetical protein
MSFQRILVTSLLPYHYRLHKSSQVAKLVFLVSPTCYVIIVVEFMSVVPAEWRANDRLLWTGELHS